MEPGQNTSKPLNKGNENKLKMKVKLSIAVLASVTLVVLLVYTFSFELNLGKPEAFISKLLNDGTPSLDSKSVISQDILLFKNPNITIQEQINIAKNDIEKNRILIDQLREGIANRKDQIFTQNPTQSTESKDTALDIVARIEKIEEFFSPTHSGSNQNTDINLNIRIKEIEKTIKKISEHSAHHTDLLFSLFNLRSAIRRGNPFWLEANFVSYHSKGNPNILEANGLIEEYKNIGLPNLEFLKKEFYNILEIIIKIETPRKDPHTALDYVLDKIKSLINIQRVTGKSLPLENQILEKAKLAIKENNLERAVGEITKLRQLDIPRINVWIKKSSDNIELNQKIMSLINIEFERLSMQQEKK